MYLILIIDLSVVTRFSIIVQIIKPTYRYVDTFTGTGGPHKESRLLVGDQHGDDVCVTHRVHRRYDDLVK